MARTGFGVSSASSHLVRDPATGNMVLRGQTQADHERRRRIASQQRLQYATTQAQEQARAASERTYTQGLASIKGMGGQQRQDIATQWQGARSRGAQGLVSSGLSGTTVAPTMQAAYTRGEMGDVGRLRDRLQMLRLGWMGQRQDVGPNMPLLAQGSQLAGGAAGSGGMY